MRRRNKYFVVDKKPDPDKPLTKLYREIFHASSTIRNGSDLRAADAGGRALLPYAGGVVPPGHVFLHSDFAGSYDSRYFGPVPIAGVLGLARPVLTVRP